MSVIHSSIDRSKAPQVHSFDDIRFHGSSKKRLDNGAQLFYIDEGLQEIIKTEIYLKAGKNTEEKNLSANFTARLLREGTTSRTAQEIAEEIDFYGASLSAKANQDFTVISILTLNKYLDKMMQLTQDILTQAVFPEKEFETVIRNSRQKYAINKEKTDFIASQRFREIMFGESHRYGYSIKDEELADLSREDLVHFYKSNYNLSNAKIFASGKVGAEELETINKYIGSIPAITASETRLEEIPESTTYREEIIHKDKALQAAIRLGRFLPNKNEADYDGLLLLNTILGGYFGSRLMSNIREEKGFTYGIYSIIHPYLGKNHMMIRTDVGVQHTEAAIEEIWKEMNRLKEEEVSDEELKLVKNYMMGNLLNESNGPFNKINIAKRLYLYELEDESFSDYIETLKTIDATQLKNLAIKYYNKDAFTLVIARD